MLGLGKKEDAGTVYMFGKGLECGICHHTRFWQKTAQLNTAVATFFNLDWTNPSAKCVICERCGYIYWFLPPDKAE
jgi:ribosomal protein S27AE